MKIILSRKGFDLENGGYPSPILPDGRLISLPIPSCDIIKYSDLKLGENQTYYDLMKELNIDKNCKKTCHLDPDIVYSTIKRNKGWKPLFGPEKKNRTHLNNERVKVGDLFLFFGTFKKTIKNNKLKFDPEDKPDKGKHVIFGYFQIGKIIKGIKEVEKWMKYHSHCNLERREEDDIFVYVAKDRLSWNPNISGAGFLRFDQRLVLTKQGFSKSRWELPLFFKEAKISRHSEKSWKKTYFQSVPKGQEIVIQDNKKIEDWAKNLIEKNWSQ